MIHVGTLACVILGSIFLIVAIIFALMKGKAAILISGFNTLSKQERELYDRTWMSRDMRNSFLIWALIFSIGAILSSLLSPYMAIAAFII